MKAFVYTLLGRWLTDNRPGERLEDLPAQQAAHQLVASIHDCANHLQISEESLERLGLFDQPLAILPSKINREEWRKLSSVLAADSENRTVEQRRKRFQRAIREKLIDRWLDEHTSIPKDSFERRKIHAEVAHLIANDDFEDALTYVRDIKLFGIANVERNRKKEGWGLSQGTLWGHAWAFLLGIVQLLVTLGVLSIAQSRFETVVFAVLILIYNAIESASQDIRYSVLGATLPMQDKLRRLLPYSEVLYEQRAPTPSQRKADFDLATSTLRLFIRSAFLGLTSLIAIVALIRTILGI